MKVWASVANIPATSQMSKNQQDFEKERWANLFSAPRIPPLAHLAEDVLINEQDKKPLSTKFGGKETPITRRRKRKHVIHLPLSDEDISNLIHMAMHSND